MILTQKQSKQEKKAKKHYITRYDGDIQDLFEEAKLYTSFESQRDVSWSTYIYYDCRVAVPFKNRCAKFDKGDFCQFVVYSEQDKGRNDLRHFSILSMDMGHDEKKIKKLRRRFQLILDENTTSSDDAREDELIQEIQHLAEDTFTFLCALKKRKHKKTRLDK